MNHWDVLLQNMLSAQLFWSLRVLPSFTARRGWCKVLCFFVWRSVDSRQCEEVGYRRYERSFKGGTMHGWKDDGAFVMQNFEMSMLLASSNMLHSSFAAWGVLNGWKSVLLKAWVNKIMEHHGKSMKIWEVVVSFDLQQHEASVWLQGKTHFRIGLEWFGQDNVNSCLVSLRHPNCKNPWGPQGSQQLSLTPACCVVPIVLSEPTFTERIGWEVPQPLLTVRVGTGNTRRQPLGDRLEHFI